jgi:Cache domain
MLSCAIRLICSSSADLVHGAENRNDCHIDAIFLSACSVKSSISLLHSLGETTGHQMKIRRFETYPRIATALTITFLLCGVLLVLLLLSKISQHIVQFENRVQAELVETGADGVSLAFNRSMEWAWEDLDVITQAVQIDNLDEVRRLIEAHVALHDSVAWAAMVNLEGRIAASSDKRGEGRNVGQAAWFKKSLSAGAANHFDVASDFADGTALFIARSVKNSEGNLEGVIVAALNSTWIQEFASEAAIRLSVEVAIFDTKGNSIIKPENIEVSSPIEQSIREYLSRQEVTGLTRQVMRKTDHILSVRPNFASTSVPFLDWHLVAVAPTAVTNGSVASFTQELFLWVIAALGLATLIPIILVAHFVRPIEKLAHSANLMADGQFDFPEERCFTREAAILSSSLARLQTQLRNVENLDEENSSLDVGRNVQLLHPPHQLSLMRRISRLG